MINSANHSNLLQGIIAWSKYYNIHFTYQPVLGSAEALSEECSFDSKSLYTAVPWF